MDQQIGTLITPLASQMEQLLSVQGVHATAARQILAEIGTDMRRFGSNVRLGAWAGMCPGNDESAGKRRRSKTRKGHRYLRRLEVRLGSKKTAMAIAHKLLGIIYHLLAEGTFYDEQRYDHLQPQQEDRQRKRAIKALEQLGSHVTVKRVA